MKELKHEYRQMRKTRNSQKSCGRDDTSNQTEGQKNEYLPLICVIDTIRRVAPETGWFPTRHFLDDSLKVVVSELMIRIFIRPEYWIRDVSR